MGIGNPRGYSRRFDGGDSRCTGGLPRAGVTKGRHGCGVGGEWRRANRCSAWLERCRGYRRWYVSFGGITKRRDGRGLGGQRKRAIKYARRFGKRDGD